MVKKKKLLPFSSIVTQANQLVSARYSLPLAEQRLLLTMIAKIQPEDEDFKPYRISVSELAEFIGVARGSAYLECKKITRSLLTRVVEIHEPGRLLQTGWVSSAEYIDGSGMVNLSFDPLLKPYLLKLKGNFTSCKLEMLLSFKSQYTMRVYTLLKQYEWQKRKSLEVEIDTLRDMLALRPDQHQEYRDFKRNILLPTQKEIADKSDLSFDFVEIKYGRRVGAIIFSISLKDISPLIKEPSLHIDTDEFLNSLLLIVPKQHREKKTVRTALEIFYKKYGFEYVKRNILYANDKADKSYAGFLNTALKSDWAEDMEFDGETVKQSQEIWQRNGFLSQKEYDQHMYREQMKHYGVTQEELEYE